MLLGSRVEQIHWSGANVSSVTINGEQHEYSAVVFCTGYESNRLARQMGLQAPAVLPVAGYSLTYPEGEHSTQLSVTDTSARTVFCRIDDKIRIAGMMDIGRKQSGVPTERLGILKAQAQSRFPEMAEYSKEGNPWIGVRAMSADNQPFIARSRELNNVYFNTGQGMLGWTLAAYSGKRLAKMIDEEFSINQSN